MTINPASRAQVQQLYALYTDALHRRNPDDWGATWCTDATWHLPLVDTPDQPMVLTGRDAIVQTWLAAIEQFAVIQHLPQLPLIKEEGGVIKARWTVREQLLDKEGNAFEILGLYDDTHREEEGMLRYSERKFFVLGRRPISGEFQMLPHPGPF